MKFTPEQSAAIDSVAQWLKDPSSQIFRLFGPAGTGKTTLAKYLAETADRSVAFGAYTGKAAHVLRSKGCENAQTIHSMIYHPSHDAKRENMLLEQLESAKSETQKAQFKQQIMQPRFVRRNHLVNNPELIILDEVSMVNQQLLDDLLSFEVPLLVLGDPAQLPPPKGTGVLIQVKPDVLLKEIHRQAADNPILELCTRARKGEFIALGNYGDSKVLSMDDQVGLTASEQIIVGMNKTRRNTINAVRKFKGFKGRFPQAGERLVCLRNNHKIGILNGEIFETVDSATTEDYNLALRIINPDIEEAEAIKVLAHRFPFTDGEPPLKWYVRKKAEEFDFGYALTCHKAQGSQFASTLILDDGIYAWDRKMRQRWLYTAISRASERTILVTQQRRKS